jgi:hypothetical protein
MKNDQPKAGRPGETSQWPRWEGPAENRPSGYLQGEADIFADDPAEGNYTDVAPAEYDRPDHFVAQAVREKLTQDAFLDPTDITVTVENGEVMLEGFVAQLSGRERAEECALSVEGVRSCRNNLRLAPERH